jgi:hypothetical protein
MLGVSATGQPLLMGNRNLLKSPLEILWIDATNDDISYVRGLYE